MQILGLIPARGGSKRIPGKNLIDLGGKPLICWTIEAACESRAFDSLAVSSDDPVIGDVAMAYDGVDWIQRPSSLSEDTSSSIDVVRHALTGEKYDLVVLLQPTSPFRIAEDICNSIELLKAKDAEAVISVTEPPKDLVFEIGHSGRMRPATRPTVVPNGALYLLTTKALNDGYDWWTAISYAYHMPPSRSIDIDTEIDLEMARTILEKKAA